MAGRPRKHSTQMNSHKTKAEIAQRKQEEAAAGSDQFNHVALTPPAYLDEAAKKNIDVLPHFLKVLMLLHLIGKC